MKRPRRKPPESLDVLLERDRNAATAFLALVALADGKRQLSVTRERITDVTGLHHDTITAAVRALHDGHWITRQYGRDGTRTWYRITLRAVFPESVKTGHSAPRKRVSPVPGKTGYRERKSNREKPGTARVSLCREKPASSPIGDRGGLQSPPLSPDGGAGTSTRVSPTREAEAEPEIVEYPITDFIRGIRGGTA